MDSSFVTTPIGRNVTKSNGGKTKRNYFKRQKQNKIKIRLGLSHVTITEILNGWEVGHSFTRIRNEWRKNGRNNCVSNVGRLQHSMSRWILGWWWRMAMKLLDECQTPTRRELPTTWVGFHTRFYTQRKVKHEKIEVGFVFPVDAPFCSR